MVLLIAAGIIAYHVFVPPLLGLADSGDFERVLPWRGLAHVSDNYDEKYLSYFNSKYRIISKAEGPDWYATSSSLLIIPARWFSIRIGQNQIFDIRILGAAYTLIFIFGIWLILAATRSLNVGLRVILSGLLVLIFTDAFYVAYFNSFYSEATALTFLAVGIGSGLILMTGRSSSMWLLIGYFLAITIVITSKPMYVPLAPAFALFGVYLSKHPHFPARYWLASGLALILCCGAFLYLRRMPPGFTVNSVYIGVFMDMLPNSNNPRRDLADLGLDPEYEIYSGTRPYYADSPLNVDAHFREEFTARARSHTLTLFYLTRPKRLFQLFARCAKHAFTNSVHYLGYYEASTDKPPHAKPFGLWDTVREHVFPRTLLFLGLFLATGIAAVVLLQRTSSAMLRGAYVQYLLFILIAGAQFFVAVLTGTGEPDLKKHLFMFNVAFDASFILWMLGAVNLLQRFSPPFLESKLRALWPG